MKKKKKKVKPKSNFCLESKKKPPLFKPRQHEFFCVASDNLFKVQRCEGMGIPFMSKKKRCVSSMILTGVTLHRKKVGGQVKIQDGPST
jgi:hypothetical protein